MKSKKAISPIISVVIMILVVVSLGVVISSFVRQMGDENIDAIEEKQDELSCGTDLNFGIVKVGGVYDICINESANYTKVTLTNSGSVNITDFAFTVIGSDDVYNDESTGDELGRDQTDIFIFIYDNSTIGNIRQIKITPKMKIGVGKTQSCGRNAISLDKDQIRDCP
jgi:flagellin-like protein